MLYNLSAGFQAYPTPTTDIDDCVGTNSFPPHIGNSLIINCIPLAPSPTNPRSIYNIANGTTGMHFCIQALSLKACTSIHPWLRIADLNPPPSTCLRHSICFAICADAVPVTAVMEGIGKIFQWSQNLSPPIAAVSAVGGQALINLETRYQQATGYATNVHWLLSASRGSSTIGTVAAKV